MENITFALPQIPSTDMSRDDQGALLVTQATAIIVSAWLDHANILAEKATVVSPDEISPWMVQKGELVDLINFVQAALRTF